MVERIYTILPVLGGFAVLVLGLSIQGAIPFLIFLLVVAGGIFAPAFMGKLIEQLPHFLRSRLLPLRSGLLLVSSWQVAVRERISRNRRIYHLTLLACVVAYPFIFTLLQSTYWIHVAVLAGIYICLALGLNMTVGFAGLLDLGYIAFYAIGAYTSAIFFKHHPQATWMFWIILPLAGLLASFFGVLLGSPTLRLRGDYLAIVTLGFGQIVRIIANNWESVTNGPKGIADIPSPTIGSYSLDMGVRLGSLALPRVVDFYFLVVLLALAIGTAANRLNHSRTGRAWVAVREDELAAASSGINVMAVKLLAFAIGASFAGIGGAVYSSLMGFVDPMSFTFMESAMIVCMVVLGGMGSIPGVIVGAIVLVVLPEKLREFQQVRMLLFGAALIAMMIFRPEGLIPSRRREQELVNTDEKSTRANVEHPSLK